MNNSKLIIFFNLLFCLYLHEVKHSINIIKDPICYLVLLCHAKSLPCVPAPHMYSHVFVS